MIQKEKMDEILKLSVDERRRVLRLLQESLPEEDTNAPMSPNGDQRFGGGKVVALHGRSVFR